MSFYLILSAGLALGGTPCVEKLLLGYTKDSHTFQVHVDSIELEEVEPEKETPMRFARAALDTLLKDLKCETGEIQFDDLRSECSMLVPDNFSSEICYIPSEQGFFFVQKDYVDTVNITFNRWD